MTFSLVEDWPFPLFHLEDGKIKFANLSAQEWIGDSLKRMKGQELASLVEAEPDINSQLKRCFDSQSPLTTRDCSIKLPRGEALTCHVTLYPVEGNTQGVSFWIAGPRPRRSSIGGDVVSGMGRMIAHELKNPLAGIKGAAQLLRDDVDTTEGKALLELISSEIDRIRRLADRMESLGDRDPDVVDEVNVHSLLRQARRIVQSAEPRLLFTERYDPSLPHAVGDPDTLMQALLNVIKNAQEALRDTPEPEITLATKFRAGVTGRVEGETAGRQLPIEIRITDNGPGIDADVQDQIFQPFVTSKRDGQGLGLALVSKVAQAHNGLVEVHSRPGKTTFSILLPAPGESVRLNSPSVSKDPNE